MINNFSTSKKIYGAWISPRGKYIEVEKECNHEGIAQEITGQLMPEIEDMLPESSYLLASGWMRIIFPDVLCKSASFQGNKFTRHQNEWIKIYEDSYIGEAENWLEFIARSEEQYNFSPIYPYGENGIKINNEIVINVI